MLENFEFINHACVRINEGKIIYTDPFKLAKDYNDADYIFITHSHYDHYSIEDIEKVKKADTKIIATQDLYNELNNNFDESNIVIVEPNGKYELDGLAFETIPAYNIGKAFHPKENGWVGYVITMNNVMYYIAGDTDITEESKNVKCDVAFVPIGGKYTMNYIEAAELINIIKPQIAVPIHYGTIVGNKEDAIKFKELLNA